MDWFRRSVDSFRTSWSGFPVSYRVLTGFLVILLAFVAAWGVSLSHGDGRWVRIVDQKLTPDQRGDVAKKLRDLAIEFKVEGDSISVAPERADEALLQIQSALGDEAFFKFLKETDFFGTREKHDRQWLVAQQGRLAAMIQRLDFVSSAMVQISEPADPKSLWWNNGRETTAAVILVPVPNESVTFARARAIATLVAGVVPGLKPSGVKIVDKAGRLYQVSETAQFDGSLLEYELSLTSTIEGKVRDQCPLDSRVSAQVRVKGDKRPEIESITIAIWIPDDSREVPPPGEERDTFKAGLISNVCAAAGANPKDVSIRIAPIARARIDGAPPAEPAVAPEPAWRSYAPLGLMITMGAGLLFAGLRLTRGMAPATEETVVAEESLRAPGESILSAQDEVLDKIRDGVRETVSKNPREAAAVARRWLVP